MRKRQIRDQEAVKKSADGRDSHQVFSLAARRFTPRCAVVVWEGFSGGSVGGDLSLLPPSALNARLSRRARVVLAWAATSARRKSC